MKKMLRAVVAVAGMIAAGGVLAQSGAEVVKSKGCVKCHAAEQKTVGPSIKDIAAKKGDAGALTAKLKEGKGHPKVAASDAEIKAAIEYMQSGK